MTEGGQSSTGQVHYASPFFVFLTYNRSQLIDFIITTHPAYQELVKLGQEQKKNIHTGMSSRYMLHSSFNSNDPTFFLIRSS
jgi:hypothetical protein